MTRPTLTVEFSPTTDPFDSPAWQEITDRVHQLKIRTGRQHELSSFQPGQVEVELDNHDREFDPNYNGSTWYPNLKPNKKIRVTATLSAVTYDMFYGFVDGWPQTYQPPDSAVCSMRATDGLKLLARSINQDPYGAVIADESGKRLWWRFSEDAGNRYSDWSGNGHDLIPPNGAPCADNVADSLTTTGQHGLVMPATEPLITDAAAVIQSGQVAALEFWCRFDLDAMFLDEWPPGSGYIPEPPRVTRWLDGTSIIQFSVLIDPGFYAGLGSLMVYSPSAVVRSTPPGFSVLDGQVHHVFIYRDTVDCRIYVDGRDMTYWANGTAGTFGAFTSGRFGLNVGVDQGVLGTNAAWKKNPTIDEVVLYDQTIADPEATAKAHNEAGRRPYIGDLPGTRIGRLLDLASWPFTDRDIDDGVTPLGAAVWDASTSVLTLLDEVERTELGCFYIDHANGGNARFDDRMSRFTDPRSTTSQATFTDDPTDTTNFAYQGVVGSFDETTTVNKVTVKWVGGDVTAADSTSITENGETAITVDTILSTYEAASYYADGLLKRYKDPMVRFASIELHPQSDQRLYPEIVSRRIGDRVTVRRQPQSVGDAVELECIVEGIDHTISDGVNQWTVTYWLSRALDVSAVFLVEGSLLDGSDGLAF